MLVRSLESRLVLLFEEKKKEYVTVTILDTCFNGV
jgi:hypothetical protein